MVFADDESADTQPGTQREALLDRVCAIYEDNTGVAIDAQALQDAFNQAQDEIAAEVMANRLDAMVENGMITQEEADQFKEWWQARPDTVLPGHPFFGGGAGGRCGPRLGGFGFPRGQGMPGATAETTSSY